MADGNIHGVQIKKIVKHEDERGFFAEILKDNDPFFENIKQTSYTETLPGVIKAFHYHEKQDDIWFVSKGKALVVMYDMREDSPTKGMVQDIVTGEDDPMLIFIPEGVAHGYKVLGDNPVCLFYHTTESYDPKNPDEGRIPYDSPAVGYDWDRTA